ncbi:hypothetical protein EVG20_g8965 [Dentipellis fragilis]|uniref:ubiquitinyl hydrolase 1 n=1 Tax=Dentipellis fragilis TaxID=205917 RepID=A0A4Y9Y1K6_9AGAM|nr:hypothetical protein EVG20_g8965 [Dentipellis fragilis]
MYLTLPLPAQKKWCHTIFYVPWDTAKPPVKVPVEINRNASFRDLRNLLGGWVDSNPDNLLTVEIFAHRIYKSLDDSVLCGELSEDDTIFCYELPSHAQQARSYANKQTENDPFIVPVFFRGTAVSGQGTQATSLFAHPFVVAIGPDDARTLEGIKSLVAAQLQRWVSGGKDTISTADSAFSLKLQANNKDFGASFSTGPTSKREESWEDRQLEDNLVLLRPNDAFYLDFSEDAKARLCPTDASAKPVPWDTNTWETFTHPEYEELLRISAEKKDQSITLQDCLDEFTKEERLGEDDPWYCPRCQKHQQATKKFDLWSVPDVLVVHLKRFSNSRALRDKIETRVDFPVRGLDLSDMAQQRQVARKLRARGVDIGALGLSADDAKEPLVYDLYAVSEHRSSELEQGHYSSDAYNHITGRWYHFADENVTPSQPESAVNEDAYLLFYKRRTSRPLGEKTHFKLQEAHSKAGDRPQ